MIESLERRSLPARRDRADNLDDFYYRTTSPETRRVYKRVVAEFWTFIQSIHPEMLDIRSDCRSLTPGDIQAFRDWLMSSPIAKTGNKRRPATVSRALHVVKALLDTLGVAPNPAGSKQVQRPVVNNTRTDFLRPPQIRNILAGPDRSTTAGARDYAILKTLFRMIPRRSELAGMLVRDISGMPGRWKIRVILKGGKEFVKPMPNDVKEAIDDYLALDKHRRHLLHSDGPDAPVFQPTINNRNGDFKKGLDGSMIWRIFHRWATYAGYKEGCYPHVVRGSLVVKALEDGIDSENIRSAGGWATTDMITRYNKRANELERNAILRVNVEEGD